MVTWEAPKNDSGNCCAGLFCYVRFNPCTMKYNNNLMRRIMNYSKVYEISFQMWPKQYTIYIAKDGVDLYSYGGGSNPDETMTNILDYLDRINRK